ncbi:MAG: 16S rRNA (cytosine(1402)-N(4))-methyltransferase RsmH [Rhodospirillales bacterium]|nr:16S rRNA (cytosine(1402)-N(4))-methyltransferase RsmH [Rhodospirillales bacterium]MDP6804898.1 16S rRNA (cytosine(1402)-N(4))-methyltransferase RsmH [Rhodospirillales bacterium]
MRRGAREQAVPHTPVMVRELLAALAPRDGGTYLDGTFGAGGHAQAVLDAADCTVLGIDRDPDVFVGSRDLVRRYGGRLAVLNGRFGDMVELLHGVGVESVDGVVLDLGVSSMQIDDAGRGFSFRGGGPLDMRMEGRGLSAAEAVNTLSEADLARIIRAFGEERAARRIARAIVEARARTPIATTRALAEICRRVVRTSVHAIDPATRTFQALRIYVNDELGELDRGLGAAEALLRPGGRLVVISFHSLEDRKVKSFFAEHSGTAPRPSRHVPDVEDGRRSSNFRLLRRGVQRPTVEEVASNPRARSARLRVAERVAAPAWTPPTQGDSAPRAA